MELPTPFFIEGPPLDLIKVSLGYAAVLEMDVHHGHLRSRTVALERETLLCLGISIYLQLAFMWVNGIFCIDLLLN